MLRRCNLLLDHCPEWDVDADLEVDADVAVGAGDPVMAFSVGFALRMALTRHAVACLVFPGTAHRGFTPVRGRSGAAEVYFLGEAGELAMFWRRLYRDEDVGEADFFVLGEHAFPGLVLHDGLTFRKFEGSYPQLRERVVEVLSGLSDHFARSYQEHKGLPNAVQAALGNHGVELSPESPNTRASDKLMRARDVLHEGETYRCEWHAKLERHRDRVHFSGPTEQLGGRVLIGIFVDHLPT